MKRILLLVFILTCFSSCEDDTDDVIIFCEVPTGIEATDITHHTALLSWTNANDYKAVTIEYGLSGFQLGTGITVSTFESEITIENLTPNMTYEYNIVAMCSVDNLSMVSDTNTFSTEVSPVVAQFLPKLSQLNIFDGNLGDLNPSSNTFEYDLSTKLYTDYAHKLRLISLPDGQAMSYDGDGLPNFPDGTVMAKTFYYNLDETNLAAGKKIIETRILIKQSNIWHLGNYVWNDAQTEADYDEDSHILPVTWIDAQGNEKSVNYEVPDYPSCVMCHQNAGRRTPLGPKLRSMNFDVNNTNQLQKFITDGHLINAPDPSTIGVLPSWEDDSFSDEERTKAYFDMNCAHCHSPGGHHNMNFFEAMDLRYETRFSESNIYDYRFSIMARIETSISGYSMPFKGVTTPHTEALALIIPFLESL